MIIAHISDSHICLPEPQGSHRLRDLEQVVVDVNRHSPDVVVHTGDIVHQGRKDEYLAARKIMAGLKAPLYVIPGNKDARKPMGRIFADAIGQCDIEGFCQYAVDDWPVRMIMLDTLKENDRLGEYCDTRLQNLATMLEASTEKPTVVFMHHPTFDIVQAPHPFQFDNKETAGNISRILEKHPQIKAIYCGHAHRYAADKVAGIPATTIPAIAMDLRFGNFAEGCGPVFEVYNIQE